MGRARVLFLQATNRSVKGHDLARFVVSGEVDDAQVRPRVFDQDAAIASAARCSTPSGRIISMATTSKRSGAERPRIRFAATLLRPVSPPRASWTFLTLPGRASAKLPSRGQVSVRGTLNGTAFQATLEPDGSGGHWLKVDRKMRDAAPGIAGSTAGRRGLKAGDVVAVEITPLAAHEEPEPNVPADLRKALASASAKAKTVWADITPIARRDWIHWIVSAKQAETRARRIRNACDMLAKGKRRPCCFDRSGMYGKSISCPVAAQP